MSSSSTGEGPEESRSAFTDGWFRTGDVAVVEKGCYRILGRKSVDIIKTGGYKVSALEIEEALLHPSRISRSARWSGLPDREWGECVAAALVPRSGQSPDPDRLRLWAKARLAVYKVPRRFMQMDEPASQRRWARSTSASWPSTSRPASLHLPETK